MVPLVKLAHEGIRRGVLVEIRGRVVNLGTGIPGICKDYHVRILGDDCVVVGFEAVGVVRCFSAVELIFVSDFDILDFPRIWVYDCQLNDLARTCS